MSFWSFDKAKPQQKYKYNLSEYGFFEGNIADQIPVNGVVPYELNTPLFSDYAEKLRFVQLPDGSQAQYNDTAVLSFPVGTTIIKTFYYSKDKRKPEKGRTLLETRLLIHEEKGWKALPYHWNENQTEAVLEVAGARKNMSWINAKGKKQKIEYYMPNMNECKGCHDYNGEIRPIGPSARQLNGKLGYSDGVRNQLEHWQKSNMIAGLPSDISTVPQIAIWNDPSTGSLDERARAWLDINCAHCHNPYGPANTSGFFLDIHQEDASVYGVFKTPVAAGRGSGGRKYDIQPGKADESILYYRIASTDPGVMMPELGRKIVHEEGVELIRNWINDMKAE